MPPNSHQTGQFSFPNHCLSGQTFQVRAQPPADWLRFEPSTVEAEPDTSFDVRVTVNTAGNRKPGTYRSGLIVVCATCAASEEPCFQDAREFPIALTIADVKMPGAFEPTAEPAVAVSPAKPGPAAPRPVIVPQDPPQPTPKRFASLIGGGLMAVGAAGMLVAVHGLRR